MMHHASYKSAVPNHRATDWYRAVTHLVPGREPGTIFFYFYFFLRRSFAGYSSIYGTGLASHVTLLGQWNFHSSHSLIPSSAQLVSHRDAQTGRENPRHVWEVRDKTTVRETSRLCCALKREKWTQRTKFLSALTSQLSNCLSWATVRPTDV